MIGLLSIGNCLHIQFHLVFLSMNFGQSIFVFLDPRILKSFWHKLKYIFEKNLDAEITRKSRKWVWWIKRSWKCLRNVSNYCTINKNMTEAAYQNWIATFKMDPFTKIHWICQSKLWKITKICIEQWHSNFLVNLLDSQSSTGLLIHWIMFTDGSKWISSWKIQEDWEWCLWIGPPWDRQRWG